MIVPVLYTSTTQIDFSAKCVPLCTTLRKWCSTCFLIGPELVILVECLGPAAARIWSSNCSPVQRARDGTGTIQESVTIHANTFRLYQVFMYVPSVKIRWARQTRILCNKPYEAGRGGKCPPCDLQHVAIPGTTQVLIKGSKLRKGGSRRSAVDGMETNQT